MTSRSTLASAALWLASLLALLAGVPGAVCARAVLDTLRAPSTLADLSLDQLMNVEVQSVYGASRYTQRSLDAPTRVTIVTADDIRDHGYRTLSEALSSVAGLFISNDRNYDYLGMRGLGHVDEWNARILVMVDGHRTNDNIFEGALIGTEFAVDVEDIDRIEVIRGPSSALYGANAVQGVINVVTRPARQTNGLHVSSGGGSLGARGGRIAWGGRLANRVTLQLSGSAYASDGNTRLYLPAFDSPATNSGVARNMDGDEAKRLLGNLCVGDFRLQGLHVWRRKDVPTAPYGTVFDAPGYWSIDSRTWLDLSWRHSFAAQADVAGRVYVDNYRYEGSYPSDYSGDGSGPVVMNRDDDVGRWIGAEVNAHRTLFGRDDFVVGGEYRDNLRQNQLNWDEDPHAVRYDDKHHSNIWALYAEDAIDIVPKVRLNAGLRHDVYTSFGGSTHPRLGLVWSVRDRTAFKLIYGSAFRVPTDYEVFLYGSGPDANLSIRPETFRTGEAVLESYFAEHYHASASYYVFRGEHFIQESLAGPFVNGGDVHGSGIELEVSARWHETELRFGGSHQILRFFPGQSRLANSPQDVAQASGKVPVIPGHVWLSADVRGISWRLNPFGEMVRGYTLADANLIARRPGSPWQISAGVRNLLDLQYGDVGGPEVSMSSVPQPGRTFRAQLDVRY